MSYENLQIYLKAKRVNALHTHNLDYAVVNMLLYLLYHISVLQSILFFDTFIINCRHQYISTLNTSACILTNVSDLFIVFQVKFTFSEKHKSSVLGVIFLIWFLLSGLPLRLLRFS